jgi:hypothetical protein
MSSSNDYQRLRRLGVTKVHWTTHHTTQTVWFAAAGCIFFAPQIRLWWSERCHRRRSLLCTVSSQLRYLRSFVKDHQPFRNSPMDQGWELQSDSLVAPASRTNCVGSSAHRGFPNRAKEPQFRRLLTIRDQRSPQDNQKCFGGRTMQRQTAILQASCFKGRNPAAGPCRTLRLVPGACSFGSMEASSVSRRESSGKPA